MTARRQLHWSHLSSLSKCGHAFKLGYLDGLRVRPGIAAGVGSGVHEVAALNLGAKIATGELMPVEQVRDLARDAFARQWESGLTLSPDEEGNPEQAHGEAIDKTVRLSEVHARVLAPRLNPTYVERAWVVTAEGFPFDLAGEIDVQEPGTIRDLKTSGKMPTADLVANSGQLTMYALAAEALDGSLPDHVALDYCVPQARECKVGSFVSVRRPGHVRAFWRRLENAAEIIERQCFTPADPLTSWMCSPRWCGYARTNPATGEPFCRYYATAPAFVAMPGTTTPKETTDDGDPKRSTRKTGTTAASREDILAAL